VLAGLGLYLFIVHMYSSDKPFLNPALFKDRNFVAANVFIFMVGVVLFATLALLPPMLQNLMDYPVVLTGLITAPRGAGTLAGMIIVGRLITRFDPRHIMALGLLMTAYSLWQMTQFSLTMDSSLIIWSGVIQGLGVGLVYVPLSAVAFTTLPKELRNEGTSFFNLLRNIGSSIGISVVMFLLTQNTQRLHSQIGESITPYNVTANPALLAHHLDLGSTAGLLSLNGLITAQGQMIAYIDDFKLMMVMTILTIPFLFLIKKAGGGAVDHPAVIE
jgi:DHA2 family multidrug resistance protein